MQKFETLIYLPIGTLDPVAKWHSCRDRVRIGRYPNISTFSEFDIFAVPPPVFPEFEFREFSEFGFPTIGGFFAPESPISISRTNHFNGFVSTIGDDGVD